MIRLLIALLILGLWPACVNVRYSAHEPVPDLEDVAEGETRYGEVLARFGAPLLMARVPNGFAMLYEDIRIDEESVVVRLPSVGKFGSGGGRRVYRNCLLLFDDRGVLRKALARGRDLATGGGMQVGTGGETQGFAGGKDYGAGPSPFNWGLRGLSPLPILLNERWSRIEIGAGGFELIDTPRDVGQHTLARPVPVEDKTFR